VVQLLRHQGNVSWCGIAIAYKGTMKHRVFFAALSPKRVLYPLHHSVYSGRSSRDSFDLPFTSPKTLARFLCLDTNTHSAVSTSPQFKMAPRKSSRLFSLVKKCVSSVLQASTPEQRFTVIVSEEDLTCEASSDRSEEDATVPELPTPSQIQRFRVRRHK
jgi:hypothetical protein